MLHSLPQQPHSSTTVRPTSDPLDMQQQSAPLEYSSREPQAQQQQYSQNHHQQHPSKSMDSPSATASPVKSADSPTRSCPNVSMSQPTTPRPTGSPSLQPLHSVTQPSSPTNETSITFSSLPPPPPPYLMNGSGSIRRKRRESDYTSDTPTFGMTHYNGNIYATDKSSVLDVRIQSKVDRGFFLADNDWTCYRRNYFQISSSFSLQGVVVLYDGQELPCFVQDQDMLHEVDQFYIGISARLSDCDKQILLIQHTAKRDKGPQNTPEARPIRPGGNLSFSSVGANQSIVTFERIQFKSATANNGKRRAAQQYYIVVMELFAKVRSSGKLVPVASTESQPVVVRGRSPGHYAESHGSTSSSSTTKVSVGSAEAAGGPIRRQMHHPHPSSALTSPPMIPGHHHPHHTPTYSQQHPMYASDYPSSYDYPSSGHNGGNGIHYVYAPSHAGVPMVPPPASSSSPGGSYDYHASPTTSSHPQQSLPPPPVHHHPYPAPPLRSDSSSSNVYDHPYQQQHYASLPPPMHRSESAPSAYDHFKEDEQQQQQQQQQQQHWARVRMASTPSHTGNHSPSTDHPPPFVASTHPHHHPYYPQPQLQPPMSYYHHHSAPPLLSFLHLDMATRILKV
ncbi:hypothetical protein BCR42DRAFT_410453 [Absidia repens]|uniref:NDT80 domain-containing protein n=1 Tax=Absidia repens TaxID=90262 RepID=A0A1X2IP02_9FUNG|nr:hypothetical protein BCR42DRAFT_410453 [Absidia repens]